MNSSAEAQLLQYLFVQIIPCLPLPSRRCSCCQAGLQQQQSAREYNSNTLTEQFRVCGLLLGCDCLPQLTAGPVLAAQQQAPPICHESLQACDEAAGGR